MITTEKNIDEAQGIFIHDVSFKYFGSDTNSITALTLHIPKGSFWGVTGPNGSGKTTFAYLLNGLIPNEIEGQYSGEVTVDGLSTKEKSVAQFSKKVGIVFQNPDHMIFNLTVREEIEFGLNNLRLENIKARTTEALALVGLGGFENRDPRSLSLGQKQKLCIALALAMETDYLILDEPSSMLDYKSSISLYKLLKKLNSNGKTIIVVEHDTDFIFSFADRVLIMNEGGLDMAGNTKDIFSSQEKLINLGIKIPHLIK